MPDPGKFVHKVWLFNPTITYTAKGDAVYNYNDNGVAGSLDRELDLEALGALGIRASILPLLGRELVVAKGIKNDITLKFQSWFTPVLTGLTRIYWYNGTQWIRLEIATPVTPDYQNRELWFYGCEITK